MKLDHITLAVSSLEQSMPYYETLLALVGFSKLKNHVWFDGEGLYFQFRQANAGTSAYERHGAGMNHLGFGASTPGQVHAIRQSMMEAGFAMPDIQELSGAVALFMKDPDGIRFEITYNPPGSPVVD